MKAIMYFCISQFQDIKPLFGMEQNLAIWLYFRHNTQITKAKLQQFQSQWPQHLQKICRTSLNLRMILLKSPRMCEPVWSCSLATSSAVLCCRPIPNRIACNAKVYNFCTKCHICEAWHQKQVIVKLTSCLKASDVFSVMQLTEN